MRYLSLCSGIETASVAWAPLGWKPVAFSEIEPFPCAVLDCHYPDVPNLGDMTKVQDWRKYRGAVDLVVGGTPCQGFSVAGKRGGMADPRSGLAGCYANLVGDVQPRWIVWENVPGVLSSGKGRDFGGFIRQLAEFGYGVSWRVLDAQYFGVPQRRRRVFVVGHLGDWRPAASVLFEPGCLRRDTPPRPKAGENLAGTLKGGSGNRGWENGCECTFIPQIVSQAMSCKWAKGTSGPAGDEHHNLVCAPVAPTVTSSGPPYERTGNSRVEADALVVSIFSSSGIGTWREGIGPLRAREQDSHENLCLAFTERGRPEGRTLEYIEEQAYCLTNPGSGGRTHSRQIMTPQLKVRRLTPRECERLQGFPDDYTLIPYRGKPASDCPDGPRYKALGNSMAVPVMRWIGQRIQHYSHSLTL